MPLSYDCEPYLLNRPPRAARELHVHRFTPGRMRALAGRCGLTHVESAFNLFLVPQFLTVLERPAST